MGSGHCARSALAIRAPADVISVRCSNLPGRQMTRESELLMYQNVIGPPLCKQSQLTCASELQASADRGRRWRSAPQGRVLVAGSLNTFSVPDVSTGTFSAGIMLQDGSVLVRAVRDTLTVQRSLPLLNQRVESAGSPVQLVVTSIQGTREDETGPAIALPSSTSAVSGSGVTALCTPPAAADPAGPGSWTLGPGALDDTSANPRWPALTALDDPARTAWRPAGTASRDRGVKPTWRHSPRGRR